MTTSVAIFEKVASRQMSPEKGADVLMKERDPMPRKPGWMPRWIYVAGIVVVAVALAPFIGNRDGR